MGACRRGRGRKCDKTRSTRDHTTPLHTWSKFVENCGACRAAAGVGRILSSVVLRTC